MDPGGSRLKYRVEVRQSPLHGLGVFARTRIRAGGVVERCPVLLLTPEDAEQLAAGSLSGHLYDWGDGQAAVALGYGSLYNHDHEPNAEYILSEDPQPEIVITARRNIEAGAEVFIDYTGGGQIELWFEPGVDAAVR